MNQENFVKFKSLTVHKHLNEYNFAGSYRLPPDQSTIRRRERRTACVTSRANIYMSLATENVN